MALRPERMLRIRIISTLSNRDPVISLLHDANAIQVEQISGDIKDSLGRQVQQELQTRTSEQLQRIKGLETTLPPVEVSGAKFFPSTEETLKEAERIDIDKQVWVLKNKEQDLIADLRDIEVREGTVSYLTGIDTDLRIFTTQRLKSYVIPSPEPEELSTEIRQSIADASIIPLNDGILVTIRRENDSDLAKIASGAALTMRIIPDAQGRPAEYLERLSAVKKERKEELDAVQAQIGNFSREYYARIVQVREQLEIEQSKFEAAEKGGFTGETFTLEGWVPESRTRALQVALEKTAQGRILISYPKSTEEPPTLLKNPRRISFFEFFIRFYSLPQESEYDPTLIFAMVFPLFFGMMVGDIGYGLVILLGSILILMKLSGRAKRFPLPKKLSRFVVVILGKGPLKTLARALIPSALSAIVFGIIFNQFFGFKILPFTLFDVTASLPTLLLVSGYIGLFMVTLGLVMGFTSEYFGGHRKRAFGKVGWILFIWGVAVAGLALLHRNFGSTESYGAIVVAIAGIGVIIATEGAMGAMELPSIISHVLSYTRIIGILLASVILAYVIDFIFLQYLHTFPMVIFAAFILVLGQIFNLAIAIFEPGIQGARLIYVEFFSKFYHGNGRPFRPMGRSRKYTIRQYDAEAVESAKQI